MKTEFVPRVNQLDAIQLDDDILRIVREQAKSATQIVPSNILSRVGPEIDLLLRTAIWNYSVRLNSATFGQRLLFIAYDEDQLAKKYNLHKHFFLNIFLKYIRDNITYRFTNRQALQTCLTYGENITAILTMLNFFRFLSVGKRPSLVDYLLGLDNISMYGNRRREIGYNNMTRELIWGGFMELLGFTLPLINYHYVKRKCKNAIDFVLCTNSSNKQISEKPKVDVNTKCIHCGQRPSLPHHMGCCHVFCYYCLHGNILADPQYECPACGRSDTIQAL